MKILITGCAGFIGSSISHKLLINRHKIIGLDNLCNSYNIIFKKGNLSEINSYSNFSFHNIDILDNSKLSKVFAFFAPDIVIHLAALTGVRKSINNSKQYQKVNIEGTNNVYLAAVNNKTKSFIFSSSSSIYGNKNPIPFSENQHYDPRSPYAKSKMLAELELIKLHGYYKLPTTILRFFSVYGPRSRPDLAHYIFTQAALKNKTITQFGNGNSARDYTYIDDVINALTKTLEKKFFWEIINIGNSHPTTLKKLISQIEIVTRKKINKRIVLQNKVESVITHADIKKAKKLLMWQPKTELKNGINEFVIWYKGNRL